MKGGLSTFDGALAVLASTISEVRYHRGLEGELLCP
jgi:hypothetical protein